MDFLGHEEEVEEEFEPHGEEEHPRHLRTVKALIHRLFVAQKNGIEFPAVNFFFAVFGCHSPNDSQKNTTGQLPTSIRGLNGPLFLMIP